MQGLQGFTFILLMQAAGEAIVRLLGLPLPGPIVGMALLLVALAWPAIRQPVQVCADFLLSHLALLFVPISVGVVTQLPLLQQYGGRIALVLLVSTAFGLVVTAWVAQWLMRQDGPPAADGRDAMGTSPRPGPEPQGPSTAPPPVAAPTSGKHTHAA